MTCRIHEALNFIQADPSHDLYINPWAPGTTTGSFFGCRMLELSQLKMLTKLQVEDADKFAPIINAPTAMTFTSVVSALFPSATWVFCLDGIRYFSGNVCEFIFVLKRTSFSSVALTQHPTPLPEEYHHSV